jgi:DNA-binding beta-propeller fold protein YncE
MIVKPIPVGNNPYFIGANRDTDTIYVANYRNTRANLLSPIIYYQFVILQTL